MEDYTEEELKIILGLKSPRRGLFTHEKIFVALKDGRLSYDRLEDKFSNIAYALKNFLEREVKDGTIKTYNENGKDYYELTPYGENHIKYRNDRLIVFETRY